jgi:Ser/Thr protein kinase RdoA (MazF antagonist)
VLAAFGLPADASAEPIPGGLINTSYLVRTPEGNPYAVAQRLHAIFAPEVNIDLDAVTAHLAAEGLVTPRLLRTPSGERWIEHDQASWRLLTYVEGATLHRVSDPAQAESAGELAGRFHRALDGMRYEYVFTRAGVHDTAAHLARLRALVDGGWAELDTDAPMDRARALGREVLESATALPPMPELPRRHAHGDMKISNVRFAGGEPPTRAVCWLDLDTLGLQTMAYELGDALRSWCNPSGEDVAEPEIDLTIFEAALRGYAAGARGLLSAEESSSIVTGLETVCIELAARFCVDAFEDRYFGWDCGRFASRPEHNLMRARGQLSLARSVRRERSVAAEIAERAFRP